MLWVAPAAQGADRIYWSNMYGNSISYANLDGSGGGGDVQAGAAPIDGPMGLVIDSVTGRIYWANYAEELGTTIGYASLTGGEGGALDTRGATINGPHGAAIDPVTRRIYWPNYSSTLPDTIAYANLDGSGGGILNTGAAAVDGPRGVTIDPATRRIYWANFDGFQISYANLDGTGGGNLSTAGATPPDHPEGVALDPTAGRIYWSDFSAADKISYANLDGSGGGGDVNTTGATVDYPHGVALDVAAGRIYWPNFYANVISYANLDGSGGGNLPTSGASVNGPNLPVLLETPVGTGAPAVGGGSRAGKRLSCTPGSWATDLFYSLLYRAPEALSYRWSRNGRPIASASSKSIRARSVGNYRCTVTARNPAGEAFQTSRPDGVFSLGRPKLNRVRGTARLPVTVPGSGTLTLSGRGVVTRRAKGPGSSSASARKVRRGTVRLLVKARGRARTRLKRTGRATVKVRVTYRPRGGPAGSQRKKVRLRRNRAGQ